MILPELEELQLRVESPDQITLLEMAGMIGEYWPMEKAMEFYSINEHRFLQPDIPLDQSYLADGDEIVLIPVFENTTN